MKVAFWKGTDKGASGLIDRAIRFWTAGQYSHCELIFSDGMTGTASLGDKGVVFLRRSESYYDQKNWDFIDIVGDEAYARTWFDRNHGAPYDLLGDLGFIWRPIRGIDNAYFCSEAIATALKWVEPWRFDPNTQAAIMKASVPTT